MARETGKAVYLALDFGTSHVKAAVGGASGTPIATARRRLSFVEPVDGPDTALEFDAQAAWELTCDAVRVSEPWPLRASGLESFFTDETATRSTQAPTGTPGPSFKAASLTRTTATNSGR